MTAARQRAPIAWCLLAAVLFGASTPAAKALLADVGPLTLAGLLYLGAAVIAAPWAIRRPVPGPRRRPDQWLRLLGCVIAGGGMAPVLLLLALSRSPGASVALGLNLEAAATALIAWVFFREHLGLRAGVACALVVGAGALLSFAQPSTALVPAGLVAGACVLWGVDNNLTAGIDAFTPAQVVLAKGLGAGSVNVALGLALEAARPGAAAALPALGLGAVSYGLSLVLYVASAQQLGAARSQLVFASAPFFGTALSWIALGEPVEAWQLAAAGIMALALALLFSARHDHAHRHDAVEHAHWHRHDDLHHDHAHAEPVAPGAWHLHLHVHVPRDHAHPHEPDLHHRHRH